MFLLASASQQGRRDEWRLLGASVMAPNADPTVRFQRCSSTGLWDPTIAPHHTLHITKLMSSSQPD
jgi:hypothetical protein